MATQTYVDSSRDVIVQIRDSDGEIFSTTTMHYNTALVFKMMWENTHIDSDRSVHILRY